jgi:methionine synthase II (cobalamin-independent)
MAKFEFECLATGIGSMPHTEVAEAYRLIFKYLPTIPFWPQLPQRSFKENMYAQFSEGFPGIKIAGEKIRLEGYENLYPELAPFYSDDFEGSAISRDYADGLHTWLSKEVVNFPNYVPAQVIKGQVTGPISYGLAIADQDGYSIIYDETLAEAIAKHLRYKATWQEKALSSFAKNTIIFVDEPYLGSLGSIFVSLPQEKVVSLLKEVLAGISGIKGLHCCGQADWSFLLSLPIEILSFDAYNYADSLGAYSDEVKVFLSKGGNIAWGIVPNDEEALSQETLSSLDDRLGETMAPFTRDGLSWRQLLRQSLLTPSCGLASLSPEGAEQTLEMLSQLSDKIRRRYIA